VIQNRITVSTSVTVRDLRNQFPKVRKLVETHGEVVLTEKGRPRYRLIAYTPAARNKAPAPKDYIERMSRFQPRALGAAQANALHDDNRGDR
jgi:antitoxin (DNA-binding transcriptional repressor) of toxin-antitoxin stability system